MTYDGLLSALTPAIPLNKDKIKLLSRYCEMLLDWNKRMNLTAIDEESEVIEKHFYDCLLPLKDFSLAGKSVIDFGTGAGFPGLVWAIVYPEATYELVDATGKKCTFLEAVIKELGLQHIKVVNKRAEETHEREKYDVVAARAVAPLPILLEIAAPLLKVGGTFIAMKSSKGAEELEKSKNALALLHLSLDKKQEESLPSDEGYRLNLFFKKTAKTEMKYPRQWVEIDKKPL